MTINSDSSGSNSGSSGSPIDELLAQGEYQAAAQLALETGLHQRATELFEQIWYFDRAAEAARKSGDIPRALKNAIAARDDQLIDELLLELKTSGKDGIMMAIAALERGRRFDAAARLAEQCGETERAIELFRRGHIDMDAARLLAGSGRDREAGRLLERVVSMDGGGDELASAQLLLGQILARRMQHEQAIRHLQIAARHPHTQKNAHRALIVELAALGLRSAARDVLVRARKTDPGLPTTVDEMIRDQRASMAPRRTSDRRVIAGRYRLDRLLGSGGAGRVYQARDEVSGRDVAIKLWSTELARGNPAYERFVREAKVASSLRHPNIIESYGFSADMGYIVMERMAGSAADRVDDDGRMSERAVRRMALDILSGLELAHQRGIIHRDIKPANIFFDVRGTAKLGDFGVAHLSDLGQTQTGGLIGTLAYMAPEQITGAPLTITADLYSLGITLFEALTGRPPFIGPDFVAQHLGETPIAPSSIAEIAQGWDAIFERLLRKDPNNRFSSIEELRKALLSIDLGEDNQPTLMLPRASQDSSKQVPPPRSSSRMPAVVTSTENRDPQAPRYQFETPLGKTSVSSLTRAVDSSLNRSVVIERYLNEADTDFETIEARLFALARGGGPFLQRILSYDRHERVIVFEAPAGRLLRDLDTTVISSRQLPRLLKRLARALAPLHERGVGHGSVNAQTILCDEALNPTILTCGLEPPTTPASPEADVEALIGVIAAVLGVKPTHEGLLAAIAPELSHPESVAILIHGPPDDAESLYQFADQAEIAHLKIWRAGWR